MLEGGHAQSARSDLKPIVLLDPVGCSGKRMLAAKVRQHPLQPPGPPARSDSQPLRQRAQVTLGRTAPDPFSHAHQTKDTPPLQRFFLRLSTVGSWLLSSRLTRSSAWLAHWPIVAWPN